MNATGLDGDQRSAWGMSAEKVDLAGDGRLQPQPAYAAKILQNVPGMQTFAVRMTGSETGHCELMAYDKGPRTVWKSKEFSVFQGPHPVIADANADGQLDVIVCPHYQVTVLDGRTGEAIQELKWHSGRNYGHFVVKNIDDDPALEMCVIADFYSHMEMIDNDGKDLKLLWRKEIELKVENKQKIVRPRWDPLQDLDGDGRFDLVVNLYNDSGDRRWHLMIYDAITGETKLDLPGMFMEGLMDIDGDGGVELFCAETEALFVPTSAPLRLLNWHDGQAVERWSHPTGGWVTAPSSYPLNINSTVARANQNVLTSDLGDGRRGFHVRIPATEGKTGPVLQGFEITKAGEVIPSWTVEGSMRAEALNVEALRKGENGGAETLISIQTASDAEGVRLKCGQGTVVGREKTLPEVAKWGSLVAGRMGHEKRMTVLAMGGSREVMAIRMKGDQPNLLWRRPGAGPLIVSDFDGDGSGEAAMLGWERSGEGNVTVRDAEGGIVWTTAVRGFPGPLEPWNFGTLTCLGSGRITGGPHDDLVVFGRRSTMQSDEGFVLSGADGRIVWHRDHAFDGERNWGFGGTPVAMFDQTGDGAEEVHSQYPVNYTVVNGKNGQQIIGRCAAAEDVFPGIWAAYSSPTLFDFDGDGRLEVMWCSGYLLGMTDLKGNTLWSAKSTLAIDGADSDLLQAYPVDWAGDGRWMIAAVDSGGARGYSADRGELQWRFPLAGPVTGAMVANVDGMGGDDLVAYHGKQISCVGVSGDGPALIWTMTLPSVVQEAILADSDGDEKLEVIALGADGVLYGVDQIERK
jgi:hypothetical protein